MSPADRLGTGTPVADFLVTDHHDTDPAGLSRRAGGPPVAELAARLLRVRERMAEQSLAALVVTDPANIYYLVGYDAWSFYTPQCLVVPARGAPALFTRAMDAAGASYTAALPSAQIHGYPEALVHRPDRHPFDWITARAVELGVLPDTGHAIVAVEGDSAFFGARGYLALAAGLQRAQLIDSRELVNWIRLVKSPYEQDLLRIAGQIATQAMATAIEAVQIGRRQCDVAAEIVAAQVRGTPEHGGDFPAIVPLLPTGEMAGTPHLTWTDEPFEAGAATTIELAGAYRHYHAPLARTVMLGSPPGPLRSTAALLADLMPSTIAALRPGVTGGQVHRFFDTELRRHGLRKESRIGYSIGIGYPPDWGERTVSLRTDESTVLTAGMAFHLIFGMWMDGWGYELSESVLITPDGAERLTHLPQTLTQR